MKKNRIPALLLAVVMVFSMIPAVAAAGFNDVTDSDWFCDAVEYAVSNKLMGGYNDTTFGPNDSLSRAMVVQVLYNKEGQPVNADKHTFPDVKSGDWFNNAVAWASKKGVVGGYGDGRFGPNDNVTLEQIAVILWNYSGKPAASADLSSVGKYSDWAGNALKWAISVGLLTSVPFGSVTENATRAQTAQVLKNLLDPSPATVKVKSVELGTGSASIDTGKTLTLKATVTPADATDKKVTWSSSDTSVATVSNGTITGVAPGTAKIYAEAGGVKAYCTVTVTAAQPEILPQVNHEYGPMKLTNYYSSGKYWWSNNISSLVFTKVEKTSTDKYKITASMQGYTDTDKADVVIYFYDANNRVLDQVWLFESVAPNTNYNILAYSYVDADVIDSAARIAFFSYSGHAATGGSSSGTTSSGNSSSGNSSSGNSSSGNSSSGNSSSGSSSSATSGMAKLASHIRSNGFVSDDGEYVITYSPVDGMDAFIAYNPTANTLQFLFGQEDATSEMVTSFDYNLSTKAVSPVLFSFESSVIDFAGFATLNMSTYSLENTTLRFSSASGSSLSSSTNDVAASGFNLGMTCWAMLLLLEANMSMEDIGFVNYNN